MSSFKTALRRTARELDLPPRIRSVILLELAADLDAAYARHRGEGMGDGDARRMAEEEILGPPEMVRRLVRLHAVSGPTWLREVGARLSERTGRVVLLVAVAPLLLLLGWVGVSGLLGAPGSLLTWIVLGVGAAIAGLIVRESLRLAAGGMPSERRLHLLLVFSAVAASLGLLAATLGLQGLATHLSLAGAVGTGAAGPAGGVALMEAGGAALMEAEGVALVEMMNRLSREASILAVGLLSGIAGALSWFVLVERTSVRALREVEELLDEGALSTPERSEIIPLVKRRKA